MDNKAKIFHIIFNANKIEDNAVSDEDNGYIIGNLFDGELSPMREAMSRVWKGVVDFPVVDWECVHLDWDGANDIEDVFIWQNMYVNNEMITGNYYPVLDTFDVDANDFTGEEYDDEDEDY